MLHSTRAMFLGAALCVGLAACPKDKASTPQPPPPTTRPTEVQRPQRGAPERPALVTEPTLWITTAQVKQGCDQGLARARALRQRLLAVKPPHTLDNTLVPYNELMMVLDRVVPMSELVANTSPDKAVRTAAEECEKHAKKLLSELKLDRGLYDALTGVDEAGLDPLARRFRAHLLRDYRRAGVDRDRATRDKLSRLHARMVALGQKFGRNLREDKKSMQVTEKQLAGMPEDWLAGKRKAAGKDGKLTLTTDYPDFYPVQSYARSDRVRRELYRLYLTRAYPDNEEVLAELLKTRYEYATTLGYSDWAAYHAEDKMVKKKQVIADFIDKVARLARPRMKADLRQILARKRKDNRRARRVGAWDRFYYVNKIKADKFGVDPARVRAYFPFARVKRGLLSLAQQLFGLTFKRREDVTVWHPKVEAYDVHDGETRLARFYLDLHPRKGKYGHAAEFPILSGIRGVQLPAASLVTNFPDPEDGPALTEHGQVTVFFHEFGHLLHQLLSGKHRWITQAGITCEWDFVEAPSQLLEEWTWDYDVLKTFARHHETGQPLPEPLFKRMLEARDFGKGVHVMRQMFYAALSFNLHAQDPSTFELMKKTRQVQRRYSPYPYQKGTAVFANFGHLNSYSSAYYTYMWSLVLAKDLLTRFKAKGLMNREVALDYRKAVLEPGGAKDAVVMVEDFLGRPYSFDAFEAWLKR